MAKLMNVFSKKENRVKPLIGSAAVAKALGISPFIIGMVIIS